MAKTKINCLNCQNSTDIENKEIKRGFGKFCSRKCSSEYNIAHRKIPTPNVSCSYCKIDFYLCDSKKNNSKSGLFFCCREHKDIAQRIGGIKEIQPSHYGTAKPNDHYHYRRIAFSNKNKKCERCGFDKHEAAIIVHHKDENRMNDAADNLEILCANCHAIEHWG